MGFIIGMIIIAVLALLVIWIIAAQRRLVAVDELCGNALSQIGIQQQSRWDALTALAELTKSYSEHEYQTLQNVIAKRQPITAQSNPHQVDEQEDILSQMMGRIAMVAEQYPDLKAQGVYSNTMSEVNRYEQQVRMSRMTYNDTVTKYNRIIRQFPSSVVAGQLNFAVREYLQMDSAKRDMPSMVIES
jgi:Uncharacterized conserved protein